MKHNIMKLDKQNKYCGIIIVREGQMFMDLVGHPYTRIYIPTNMILFIHYLS
jgi:hypothetical protein